MEKDNTINNNAIFLPHLIQEEIYIIPEGGTEANTGKAREKKAITNATVVVLSYPVNSEILPADHTLLTKILKAVKIPEKKAIFINLNEPGGDRTLFEHYDFKECKILFFIDRVPEIYRPHLPDNFYEIRITGGNIILLSHAIKELHGNESYKKLLWGGLKTMYGLDE